jgi:fructose-bisphosphate aldolase, class II
MWLRASLNQVLTHSVLATLAARPAMVDGRRYLGPAREAVAAEAARLPRLLNLQAAESAAH